MVATGILVLFLLPMGLVAAAAARERQLVELCYRPWVPEEENRLPSKNAWFWSGHSIQARVVEDDCCCCDCYVVAGSP
jgi:hypothetical protein